MNTSGTTFPSRDVCQDQQEAKALYTSVKGQFQRKIITFPGGCVREVVREKAEPRKGLS